MRFCPLVLGLIATSCWCADVPAPSQMYVVSSSFSDFGALFYYRVRDVRTEGPDVVVQYSRIGWMNQGSCPRKIVQSAEVRLKNRTIGDLVGKNNPCAVNPRDLANAIKKYSTRDAVFETFSAGVVATCGSKTTVLGLPHMSQVGMKKLKSAEARLGRLWALMSDVTEPAFGKDDLFHERTEAEDMVLQRAGQATVPELASGRYDEGLAVAMGGNIGGSSGGTSFRDLLRDYRGPITGAEANAADLSIVVVDPQHRFALFTKPKYPPLAALARIQGDVSMRVAVDRSTGEVRGVEPLSGDKLLQESAMTAARSWRFEPNSVTGESISLTMRFALSCR